MNEILIKAYETAEATQGADLSGFTRATIGYVGKALREKNDHVVINGWYAGDSLADVCKDLARAGERKFYIRAVSTALMDDLITCMQCGWRLEGHTTVNNYGEKTKALVMVK